MNTLQPSKRHKHRRSVSRKLDEGSPIKTESTIALKTNPAPFDVQYFVQKSSQTVTQQTTIIDDFANDENHPPPTFQSARPSSNTRSTKSTKMQIPMFPPNTPFNKDSEYFPHWDEEENFTCLSKLKNYFNYQLLEEDESVKNSRVKCFRERHKNKILEINAEYQIENRLGGCLKEIDGTSELALKTARKLNGSSRRCM